MGWKVHRPDSKREGARLRFIEIEVPGAFLVEIEPVIDERGFFARSFCREEFARHGLEASFSQVSLSYNNRRCILRGLHYQAKPHGEVKVVRCVRGAVFDVIVDLRHHSRTYCRWFGQELSEDNHKALYIPEGVAHGFLTLTDTSEVEYQISVPYAPESARGVRWNDPAFGIKWPDVPKVVSTRDQGFEDFAR
jgi:dTDP-4-dehydrorhamnose 3,5-epimerase